MKKIFIASIIIFSSVFFGQNAYAKSVYFSLPSQVEVGEVFELGLMIDTDEEVINSVDFVIDFPENLVEFSGYRENDTNIKLWVESPNERDGKIYLSGIIPGGIDGVYEESSKSLENIKITKLLFKAKKNGTGDFSWEKVLVLKHDGKGTKFEIPKISSKITISGVGDDENLNQDIIPPKTFEVVFIKETEDSPNLIYFKADDIGSGIQKYEVRIGKNDWQETKSPKEVERGIFDKKVLVRAYDFSGNVIEGEGRIPGVIPNFLVVILVLLLFGFLGIRMIKYKV